MSALEFLELAAKTLEERGKEYDRETGERSGDGIPTFTFRGDELIGFIWHIYALARIVDAIKDMPELPKEADPMEDQGAQDELIQGWIDELQSLQVRDDGTVVFDERPWLVNCESPNV